MKSLIIVYIYITNCILWTLSDNKVYRILSYFIYVLQEQQRKRQIVPIFFMDRNIFLYTGFIKKWYRYVLGTLELQSLFWGMRKCTYKTNLVLLLNAETYLNSVCLKLFDEHSASCCSRIYFISIYISIYMEKHIQTIRLYLMLYCNVMLPEHDNNTHFVWTDHEPGHQHACWKLCIFRSCKSWFHAQRIWLSDSALNLIPAEHFILNLISEFIKSRIMIGILWNPWNGQEFHVIPDFIFLL